jgi:DNA-binding CsgD family transcriptional regulator
LRKSVAYNDSLINEETISSVAEMKGKYEYERNKRIIAEKEIEVEQSKLKLVYWVALSVFLIIVFIILTILYYFKQKNSLLLKGKLALIGKQNRQLQKLNQEIKAQLDKTQISLEDKEEILEFVYSKSRQKKLPEELVSLSKREVEVLSYLALGWSDEQLANKLFVSKATIKTHLRRIYSKLLVRGRAEAVTIAHKFDLLAEENVVEYSTSNN